MTDKEMCAIFAKNLTDIMSDRLIRQADIVRELKVAKGTVSGWCSGSNIPRTDTLSRLTQMLGVNPSDLLTEKKPLSEDEHKSMTDDSGFFRVMQSAKDRGYTSEDLQLALDFLERARKRDQE